MNFVLNWREKKCARICVRRKLIYTPEMMVAILFILAALKVGVSVERTFFQREPEIHIRIVILLKLKSISTFNIPFVKNRMLTYRIDQD